MVKQNLLVVGPIVLGVVGGGVVVVVVVVEATVVVDVVVGSVVGIIMSEKLYIYLKPNYNNTRINAIRTSSFKKIK